MRKLNSTDYCNHLYNDTTDGYIQIIDISDSEENKIKIYNTENKNLREIVYENKLNKDVYIAPNTMYLPKRRVENIRQFRALFQDLDTEKLGLEKAETVYRIWEMYYQDKIPKPTMVIDSGKGLHIYWRIKNAPYGALATWQELQDYIYYQLKELGADKKATDGARVLRLPNTINSKNNKECEVVYIDKELEYTMYDLREQYLNYKVKSYQFEFQETKKNNRVVTNKFFNSYSLHITRASDLEKLCKLRNYNLKGYRNMVIHCYAYWKGIYIRDEVELEKEVIQLNNAFIEPLKETEVQAVLRCIPKAVNKFINYEQGIRSGENKRVSKGMRDKEGYWYKNSTLIERLDITEKEQEQLDTIIGTRVKYNRNNKRRNEERRNENGLTKKQQELEDLKIKVVELKKEGLSIRKIAEKLEKSKGTIENILKKL